MQRRKKGRGRLTGKNPDQGGPWAHCFEAGSSADVEVKEAGAMEAL